LTLQVDGWRWRDRPVGGFGSSAIANQSSTPLLFDLVADRALVLASI